jgi:hypothetical protein
MIASSLTDQLLGYINEKAVFVPVKVDQPVICGDRAVGVGCGERAGTGVYVGNGTGVGI